MSTPIIQFGTSRFLQAHVDLFVSEALDVGQALGKIAIVQTTGSAARAGRLAGLAAPEGFPVIVRGLEDGVEVNRTIRVRSVDRALSTATDWNEVKRLVTDEAEVLISNTGDTGYSVDGGEEKAEIPASFPGKLLLLLQTRYRGGGRPISILPCELVSRNGDVLKSTVLELQEGVSGTPVFPAGLPMMSVGPTRWSTGSFQRRWSLQARLQNPMRSGRSSASRASSSLAPIQPFCSLMISASTRG